MLVTREREKCLSRINKSRVYGLPANDNSEAFDVIVSADTLVYFGDLRRVLAAARALRPNGLFVFTLEHMVGGEADVDYHLELHGRYSHAPAYVERLLAAVRLLPEIVHAELRMESGAPVAGLVIRAAKSVAARP
jgi:Predicted methyltransferase (contains TPR repeat)